MEKSKDATWHYDSKEQETLAQHIIGLEKAALNKWFNGDTSGYNQLWSRRNFSYFDAVVTERINSHEEIEKVLATIEGKLFADSYDFKNPRVQFSDDMSMGVLPISSMQKLRLLIWPTTASRYIIRKLTANGTLFIQHGRSYVLWI